MGAPRKNPPPNIHDLIEQYVAGEGGSAAILARVIGVASSTVRRWFKADESLKDAYDDCREVYMHKLYLELLQMSRTGKGNPTGIIFTLKARFHQWDKPDTAAAKVDVNVNNVQPVLVVVDHGSNDEWAAKALAQQQALTAPEARISLPVQNPDNALPWIEGNIISSDDDEVDEEASDTVPTKMLDVPSWRGNA
jgi:hypothetical protein